MSQGHVPVLLDEVVSLLPKKPESYVDLTLGRAGHARRILQEKRSISLFIGVDRDQEAISQSREILSDFDMVEKHYVHSDYVNSFRSIARIANGVDLVLMDVGVSSPQFDEGRRGFSYRLDGPLDMRMDRTSNKDARTIVNGYSERELVRVFQENGQCPESRRVARAIVERRREKSIDTTYELVDVIKSALSPRELHKKGHPAKQFFLAIRYEVNDELEQLRQGVHSALDILNPNGRLIVISFNFLEDRIVKEEIRKMSRKERTDKFLPVEEKEKGTKQYRELTRKPLTADEKELSENNRSKSAILRAVERSK